MNASATPGQIGWFPSDGVPSGWLLANGAAVSRTVYAGIFAIIGTKYGAGDGSTTFNLPDLRGEFIRSADAGRGLDSGRGVGSVQGQSIQSHDHVMGTDPGLRLLGGWNAEWGGGGGGSSPVTAWRTAATGDAETRPRNFSLLACIKV